MTMHNQISCGKIQQLAMAIVMVCLLATGFISCEQIDSNYKDFLKEGEIIYPEKANYPVTYPGMNRIKISWLLVSDPSITSCKVFWDNKSDSIVVPVKRKPGTDTIQVIINNLEERVYTFEIFTYDNAGNQSVGSEVSGTVYGENYQSSLLNRKIRSSSFQINDVVINWYNAEERSLGVEIEYTDNSDRSRKIFVSSGESSIILQNISPMKEFQYRSVYLPDSLAIDTFYTDYALLGFARTEVEVDRSEFQLLNIPGDYAVPNSSTSNVELIWTANNAITNTNTYISKVNGHPFPQWFTIDLGREYQLTKIKLYQRGDAGANADWLYSAGNVMRFEVWGALAPDVTYNPDDHEGVFDNTWSLLQTCNVSRPTGNTIPTVQRRKDNTPEDIQAAQSGHEFVFNNAGRIRYLRINSLANWHYSGQTYVNIAAIRLWSNEYSIVNK